MSKALKQRVGYTILFVCLYSFVSSIKQPYVSIIARECSVTHAGMYPFILSGMVIESICNASTMFDEIRRDPSNSFFFDLLTTIMVVFFCMILSATSMYSLMKSNLLVNTNYFATYVRFSMTAICASFMITLINRHMSNKSLATGTSLVFGMYYLQTIMYSIMKAATFKAYLANMLFLSICYVVINFMSKLMLYIPIVLLYSDTLKLRSSIIDDNSEDRLELNPSRFILNCNIVIGQFSYVMSVIRQYISSRNLYYVENVFSAFSKGYIANTLFFILCFGMNYAHIYTNFKHEQLRETLTATSCMALDIPNDRTVSNLLEMLIFISALIVTLMYILLRYILNYIGHISGYTHNVFALVECIMLVTNISSMYRQIRVIKLAEKPDISRDMHFE